MKMYCARELFLFEWYIAYTYISSIVSMISTIRRNILALSDFIHRMWGVMHKNSASWPNMNCYKDSASLHQDYLSVYKTYMNYECCVLGYA